jgi:nucleoside-diphosphate-sugar epimerase
MKVAITGATGGLGRSLTEFLLRQHVDVVALGRNPIAGASLKSAGAEFFAGDATDLEYLKHAFAGCDLAIHSAGLASPWGPWKNFYHSNVLGTETVLKAMRDLGIKKLIYISTPSLYFSGEPFENRQESEPLPKQQTFYGRSKLMADKLVLKEVQERGLDAILFRPRAIFGKYDTAIIPRMLRLMKKGFFPLPGGGDARVDVTAVQNIVHAIWLAILSKEKFKGETVNITNGEPVTVRELTKEISDALGLKVKFISVPLWLLRGAASAFEFYADHISGKEPLVSRYSIDSIGTTQTLSIQKAKELLKYEPVITTKEAIKEFAKSVS